MLNESDVFESSNLRSAWFDFQGFLKSWVRPERGRKPVRRKAPFAALLATAAISLVSIADAVMQPVQLTLALPIEQSALATKHALLESIKSLRLHRGEAMSYGAPAPVERSLTVAQYIIPQFPDVVADARAGLNDEGNVFVRFSRGEMVAYVTVEPKAMHLLVMEPGRPNVYLDDEKFGGKVIPDSIKRVLAERFV